MNARVNKIISISLSILMCLSIVVGTVLALSDLFKVGMSIQVEYDPSVTAKVYLSTDSTGAGGLMQPQSQHGNVNVGNFRKENAALVLNTYDTDTNGGKVKNTFENLGKNEKSLICDPNGEMQFYVYVENFSETDSVYYRANISFGNGSGTTPFNVTENPNYAVSNAVSGSTGGGGV